METVLSSFVLVAASEMGDKTQLLAFSLAARFKRPLPILAGILVATLLNHAMAAWLGNYAAGLISPETLRIVLALLFFAFALWTLKPDTLDDEPKESRWGPFATTAVLFFLAEMGDKTQLATLALGARFDSAIGVTTGTTLGMMLSDGIAVFVGQHLADRLPMKWIRRMAAILFFIFGLLILIARPSTSFASEPHQLSGSWVGEMDFPRGIVLIGHGLNLKPSRMRALAETICNRESGLVCRILELPGHEEQSPMSMKQVSAQRWKQAVSSEVDQVARIASEHSVPAYFLGYSLGGLMGEWALLSREQSPFKKVVLIAPALSAYFYVKAVVCLPLTDGVVLPSKNHVEYRVHSGTSLGAYRAMFAIMREVRKSASKRLDIPTLIFTNPADELVDAEALKRWAEDSAFSKWEFVSVPLLEPKLKPVYQHLMIDSASMGNGAFSFLSSRVREFLN